MRLERTPQIISSNLWPNSILYIPWCHRVPRPAFPLTPPGAGTPPPPGQPVPAALPGLPAAPRTRVNLPGLLREQLLWAQYHVRAGRLQGLLCSSKHGSAASSGVEGFLVSLCRRLPTAAVIPSAGSAKAIKKLSWPWHYFLRQCILHAWQIINLINNILIPGPKSQLST